MLLLTIATMTLMVMVMMMMMMRRSMSKYSNTYTSSAVLLIPVVDRLQICNQYQLMFASRYDRVMSRLFLIRLHFGIIMSTHVDSYLLMLDPVRFYICVTASFI